MIQSYLKEQAQIALPQLEWTIDFYTGEDNTGTVYVEGGGKPDIYDANFRFPEYMVLVRSSDWPFTEVAAQRIFDLFHKSFDFQVTVPINKVYQIYFLEALSEPLRLGVNNKLLEYSINFRVTLREVK